MAITPATVRHKLATDIRWLVRAILAIAARQTDHEYHNETTQNRNYRGFNSADAPRLTSYAKQIQTRQRYNNPILLTDAQVAYARRRMPKYARQLCRIAAERAKVAS